MILLDIYFKKIYVDALRFAIAVQKRHSCTFFSRFSIKREKHFVLTVSNLIEYSLSYINKWDIKIAYLIKKNYKNVPQKIHIIGQYNKLE